MKFGPYLGQPNVGKMLEGQHGLLPVDRPILQPRQMLGFINPCGRDSADAHPVADKDDDVLGRVGVDAFHEIHGLIDFGPGLVFPECLICMTALYIGFFYFTSILRGSPSFKLFDGSLAQMTAPRRQ